MRTRGQTLLVAVQGEDELPLILQVQNPSLEGYHWLWISTCISLVQCADAIFSF